MMCDYNMQEKAKEMYEKIDYEAKLIWSVYSLCGYETYFVGGCVRDFFIGKTPKDYDLCTDAKPEEAYNISNLINCFNMGYSCKVIDTGAKYGTMTFVITDNRTGKSSNYEVTTMRKDGEYTDGRRPDNVEFSDDIVEDLMRRDFTINAIALNPSKYEFIDPFDGIKDIEKKRIRCVGHAPSRFKEDGLRILRALRFSVQLKFDIAHQTMHAMILCSGYLNNISKERIRGEINKIIMNDSSYVSYIYHGNFKENDMTNLYIKRDGNRFNENVARYGGDDLMSRCSVIILTKGYAGIDYEESLRKLKYTNKEIKSIVELVGYIVKETAQCIKLDMDFPPIDFFENDDTAKQHVKRIMREIGVEQSRRLAFVIANLCSNLSDANKMLCLFNELIDEIIDNNECYNISMLDINGDILKNNISDISGEEIGIILETLCSLVIVGQVENNMIDLLDLAICIHENS